MVLNSYFNSMIDYGYGVIGFILLMGIIVFIHEFGHYYIARLCGVQVDIFSVGFGKIIASRQDKQGCLWSLSLIPFGGYVKFFGDKSVGSDGDSEVLSNMTCEEKSRSFYYKAIWQKMLIILAGPVANILLCFIILFSVYFFNGIHQIDPLIMKVDQGLPAAEAGLKIGDKITHISGHKIKSAEDVTSDVFGSFGEEVSIDVLREGKKYSFLVKPILKDFEETKKVPIIGVSFYNVPLISGVMEGMPAEKAGIQVKDLMIRVGKTDVHNNDETIEAVTKFALGEKFPVTIIREGKEISLPLTLKETELEGQKKKMIGVIFAQPSYHFQQYNFFTSLDHSLDKMISVTKSTMSFIKILFLGKAHTEHLSGPIKIGSLAGKTLHYDGFLSFFYLMAFVSLSIGLVNLFPIPMLDGGHLVLYAYEAIFRRRVSPKFQEYIFKFGFVLIMMLMIFTILNDLGIINMLKVYW